MSTQITPTSNLLPPVDLWPDDEPELTDDELYELEAAISRDHDDSAYWTERSAR